jgi:hypothetical protein
MKLPHFAFIHALIDELFFRFSKDCIMVEGFTEREALLKSYNSVVLCVFPACRQAGLWFSV